MDLKTISKHLEQFHAFGEYFMSGFGFPWFNFAEDVVSNLYYHSIVLKLLLQLNATLVPTEGSNHRIVQIISILCCVYFIS